MFAKKSRKKVLIKTTETAGNLVGNEIADKITSGSKPKNEEPEK